SVTGAPESRVFLDGDGKAIGSMSGGGRSVSVFAYGTDNPATPEDESAQISYIDQYEGPGALTETMPSVTGAPESRVFLDGDGKAIGSMSGDGKSVSVFAYGTDNPATEEDESDEITYIDQYEGPGALTETMPSVTGAPESRVFLDGDGK